MSVSKDSLLSQLSQIILVTYHHQEIIKWWAASEWKQMWLQTSAEMDGWHCLCPISHNLLIPLAKIANIISHQLPKLPKIFLINCQYCQRYFSFIAKMAKIISHQLAKLPVSFLINCQNCQYYFSSIAKIAIIVSLQVLISHNIPLSHL